MTEDQKLAKAIVDEMINRIAALPYRCDTRDGAKETPLGELIQACRQDQQKRRA